VSQELRDVLALLAECRTFVAYAYDKGIVGAEEAGLQIDHVLTTYGLTAGARPGSSAGDHAAPTAPVSHAGLARQDDPVESAHKHGDALLARLAGEGITDAMVERAYRAWRAAVVDERHIGNRESLRIALEAALAPAPKENGNG
jgi:hypothetical protein